MQHCQHYQFLYDHFDYHEAFYEDSFIYLSDDDPEIDLDLGYWQPFGILLIAGSPARPVNVSSIGSPFNDDGRLCMR
jgi:hypothetical protein